MRSLKSAYCKSIKSRSEMQTIGALPRLCQTLFKTTESSARKSESIIDQYLNLVIAIIALIALITIVQQDQKMKWYSDHSAMKSVKV